MWSHFIYRTAHACFVPKRTCTHVRAHAHIHALAHKFAHPIKSSLTDTLNHLDIQRGLHAHHQWKCCCAASFWCFVAEYLRTKRFRRPPCKVGRVWSWACCQTWWTYFRLVAGGQAASRRNRLPRLRHQLQYLSQLITIAFTVQA